MARIVVDVEEIEMDGDHGTVAGVMVTCPLCGHSAEAFGTEDDSLRFAAATLAQECPRFSGPHTSRSPNFYVAVWEGKAKKDPLMQYDDDGFDI